MSRRPSLVSAPGTVWGRGVLERLGSPTPEDVRTVGGILAAAVVASSTIATVALNASLGRTPAGLPYVADAASTAAVVVPGVVAVAIGVVADTGWSLVGLVAAGLFAVLALVAPPAGVPSVGVLLIAAVLVALPTLTGSRRRPRRAVFGGFVLAAVGLSLGGNADVLAPGARSVGTTATLAALVVAPAVAGASRRSVLAGAGAAVPIAAGAVLSPFVASAVFLTAGAAIDPNVVLAALGVGGGVAVIAEGVRRSRPPLSAGGVLLLAAGVPATVPRGLAVVLGAHLLLVATRPEPPGRATGGDEP